MSAFNIIILAISALMLGFLAIWWLFPRFHAWMEAPKYRVLMWEQPPAKQLPLKASSAAAPKSPCDNSSGHVGKG